MKVYMLARIGIERGIIYVYAHDDKEAIATAQRFIEFSDWKVIKVLEDFTQIIYYDES